MLKQTIAIAGLLSILAVSALAPIASASGGSSSSSSSSSSSGGTQNQNHGGQTCRVYYGYQICTKI